jgi:hypothetical protein
MKLLDRLSLWVLSIASMLMSLLLLLLILVPGLAWLQVPGVRIGGFSAAPCPAGYPFFLLRFR